MGPVEQKKKIRIDRNVNEFTLNRMADALILTNFHKLCCLMSPGFDLTLAQLKSANPLMEVYFTFCFNGCPKTTSRTTMPIKDVPNYQQWSSCCSQVTMAMWSLCITDSITQSDLFLKKLKPLSLMLSSYYFCDERNRIYNLIEDMMAAL